jgi:pyrroline-5-carboxylate reductase
MKKIAIIGGGNLGTAIATGLIKSGFITADKITVTKRNTLTLVGLQSVGITVSSDNLQAVKDNDIILLAVKPFQIKEVLEMIAPFNTQSHRYFRGYRYQPGGNEIGDTKRHTAIQGDAKHAIAIQESITCISSVHTTEDDKKYVNGLFSTLGKIALIDEKLMNAATVLGACGTAFACGTYVPISRGN